MRIDLHAHNIPFDPIWLKGNVMSFGLEGTAYGVRYSSLDPEQARLSRVRIGRAGKVSTAEFGGFNGLLQRHAKVDDVQKTLWRPLILLVQAHSSKGHEGLSGT